MQPARRKIRLVSVVSVTPARRDDRHRISGGQEVPGLIVASSRTRSGRCGYDSGVPSITIALGVTLIVLGLAGYFLTGAVSLTALIPSAFGLVLAICGAIARDPGKRKHAMHAAVVVALLGFLGSARGLLQIGALLNGTAARPAAVISQTIMAVVMIAFVALCVRSFIAARRARALPAQP